jgi:hypothetical protein
MRWFLALLLFALGGRMAMAAPLPEGRYVYSDFCVGPNVWDVSGHRVEFHHAPDGGDDVIIEFDEAGGDAGPIHATPVHFDPATGALNFSYQTQADDYTFDGTVTEKGLSGTFEYDVWPRKLPRVTEDAAVRPACPSGPQQR